jgi:hypothetical protein
MAFGISKSRLVRPLTIVAVALLTLVQVGPAFAHGERAQTANLRMRTVNWYDTEITPKQVAVGEEMIIRGKFETSKYWPEHVPSVTGRVYLNVGAAGPKYIKVRSTINGKSMFQSTQLELGKHYEYEIVLKARTPGRFHLHPVLNVLDSGGLIGPGYWGREHRQPSRFYQYGYHHVWACDRSGNFQFGRNLRLACLVVCNGDRLVVVLGAEEPVADPQVSGSST